jgi:hypothetical protein
MNLSSDQKGNRDKFRIGGGILFGVLLVGIILVKSQTEGWFESPKPLELNDQPALVFFILTRGCECETSVVKAAEDQLQSWTIPDEMGVPIITVDFYSRSDLVDQYHVARAPALVLLDGEGQLIWKQDLGLSDEAPLDLAAAEQQLNLVMIQ